MGCELRQFRQIGEEPVFRPSLSVGIYRPHDHEITVPLRQRPPQIEIHKRIKNNGIPIIIETIHNAQSEYTNDDTKITTQRRRYHKTRVTTNH